MLLQTFLSRECEPRRCDEHASRRPRGRLGRHGRHVGLACLLVAFLVTAPALAQSPCAADTNDDDLVDIQDLLTVLGNWGDCPGACPPSCTGDILQDCTINVVDLLAVLSAWGPCPLPDFDRCDDPLPIEDGTHAFDTLLATDSPSDPPWICGVNPGRDIWFCYTAPVTGIAKIQTCESDFDTVLQVYSSCDETMDRVSCDDDGCGWQSEVWIAVEAGSQYKIRIGGWNGDFGHGVLKIASAECTPPYCGSYSYGVEGPFYCATALYGDRSTPVLAIASLTAILLLGYQFTSWIRA